jgi:hypothetical protein
MFNNLFENIDGVSIFPVFSLLLFVAIFVFVVIWIIRLKKSDIIEMKNIPLNDSYSENKIKNDF